VRVRKGSKHLIRSVETMRDPLKDTSGQDLKATRMGKTAIQRAISKGYVSVERTESGEYRIDPSEPHRVFPLEHSGVVADTAISDTRGPRRTHRPDQGGRGHACPGTGSLG